MQLRYVFNLPTRSTLQLARKAQGVGGCNHELTLAQEP